ncbi:MULTISPECIES: response regulator [unclassified Hahella]|uniref:response regulator n=1 Tax=unclassified Hahella TaxID=2624107 RepID=UPI000FDE6C72|nr:MULTISPECIES: response regulator [unclassified Hahella]AZZ90148.1 response regulator [Hahella sp. KA22]MBU6954080.1 response regulator [Hahella sp. HN01]MDG9668831.1 response regulator [Hahella sp. CR1]QAY53518.1 response regulator [Hahella sp. KA22]
MTMNIVIADDSSLSRRMVMNALPPQLSDVEITFARNGKEAMDAYYAGKADVMFLDLTMPEMDGYTVLKKLKEAEANTIVCVISADIQPEAQQRVLALGAACFIGKPVTTELLRKRIHDIGLL